MKLPVVYETNMKELLGDTYDTYIASLEKEPYQGLRVNTSKISVKDFRMIAPCTLQPVPWCSNGFYYDKKDKPSKHPYYYAGLYYIQEPSAMTPASFLPISEGDRVLDLCAAPGGKSTELAARLRGTGLLVSNDISSSRAKALLKNLELFGVPNVLITCETPHMLAEHFPHFFDKILIDAPCSGEGMFRRQSHMSDAWKPDSNRTYSDLQRSILQDAVRMLKPGGMLIYSTCTFSKLENEQSVEYLLSLDETLSLRELPMYPGFDTGHPEWGLTGNAALTDCRRLWPHRIEGEGHFVALFQKRAEDCPKSQHPAPYIFSGEHISDEANAFLQPFHERFPLARMDVQGDRIFFIPDAMPDIRGLRILRCGLYVGDMKKKRFEPSQAFAMCMDGKSFPNTLRLAVSDERVIRYLKGETVLLTDEESGKLDSGICLICVDGYPLGFGKHLKGVVKNKYLPGWRWM